MVRCSFQFSSVSRAVFALFFLLPEIGAEITANLKQGVV
jgi:hypothetical protein